ncbi:MAG: hypothetical protein AABY27_01515 [Pseudomonadota bacterium]
MSRISIEVTDEQHTQIKVMASLQKKTIKDLIIENIFNAPQTRELNQTTLEAIKDISKDNDLNIYESVGTLFARFNK